MSYRTIRRPLWWAEHTKTKKTVPHKTILDARLTTMLLLQTSIRHSRAKAGNVFRNRAKGSTSKVDIVASANALLGRVAYDRNDTKSDDHCKVEVRSRLFDENEAKEANPLHAVLVYITPKKKGGDYQLFAKAAVDRLYLIFAGCICQHKGAKLDITRHDGDGISLSINHRVNCLKRGGFLRLGK